MSKKNRENEYNRLKSLGKKDLIPKSLSDEFDKIEPIKVIVETPKKKGKKYGK